MAQSNLEEEKEEEENKSFETNGAIEEKNINENYFKDPELYSEFIFDLVH